MDRCLWALLAPLLLAGCTTLPVSGRSGEHVYFGLVRVVYPKTRGPLVAADVQALGLGFDGGLFLGWRDSKFVYARPENCRVVVIVRDARDLPHVETMLRNLGDGACIAGQSPPR